MPFIGNQPALSYTSFAKQDFTTSATTSYTLDNPVANENEIALFINFVRQEPTTAYTASGTSLTLTSATASSDDMYCVFLGKAVQTVNPPNGSVGASQIADSSIALGKLSATGTKDSTTFLRGDNTFASAGGTNTPAFRAINSTTQNLSGNGTTFTKVILDTEQYDTDNGYDPTTNYRFTVPSGQAGKYFVSAQIGIACTDDFRQVQGYIRKNGSSMAQLHGRMLFNSDLFNDGEQVLAIVGVLDLSVGDYLELWGRSYDSSGTGTVSFAAENSTLQAFKLVE